MRPRLLTVLNVTGNVQDVYLCKEMSSDRVLAGLQNEADAYRKVRLRVEDVQGKNCLTNFWVSH